MARRLRLAEGKRGVVRVASALAAALALLAGVDVWHPSAAAAVLPWAVGAAAASLLGVLLWNALRPVPTQRLDRALDRGLHLPDLALTSGQLAPERSEWLARQHRQTCEALAALRPAATWPARWPRGAGLSFFAVGGLLALLWPLHLHHTADQRAATQALEARAAARSPIEEMFAQWEAHAPEDEALARLLAAARPLQERLREAGEDDRQRFAELNQLEALLQTEQARAEAASLEPVAGKLAEALAKLEGMEPLAAALRSAQMSAAAERAGEAAQKLEAPQAATAASPEAASALSKTGEALAKAGNRQAGEGLCQMGEGAREGNARKLGSGLRGLQDGLRREAARRKEANRLAQQLRQLAFCKSCLGSGQCEGLLPALFQRPGGKNAGSQSAPKDPGLETQLASQRMEETLEGTAGEGESEVTTQQASHGEGGATRAPVAARFAEYARLSQQAVEDEALPLAHRETIKQYFERIRPKED